LGALTSAKPKIADYEFTTLKPNLGIVQYRDFQSFVIADIPGIIEGAAEGKGLGHYFLRHIERNSILLFLIPADTKNLKSEFDILKNELVKYNPELLDKNYMVILSKADLLDDELKEEYRIEMSSIFKNTPHLIISSATQFNLLFPNLQATVGGETGIDIAPRGSDKSQILRDFNESDSIHFYGDAMHDNGNDYPLAHALLKMQLGFSHPVIGWQDTWKQLKEIT
jgi:GTPase involved in cell partitioning and DNA repair